jgi:hypothetical protein
VSRHRSTEELVARLAAELAPVRPVLRLRHQALAVAAGFAASAAGVGVWLGLDPVAALGRGAISATLAGALALVGVGGVALGLAARIPGRERISRVAAAAICAGGVTAAALALAHAASGAESGALAPALAQSGHCAARSLLLAIPSGLLALALARRGAPWRTAATGLGLAAGAVSLGALLVHLSCPSPSAWHWLCAHALLPWLAGVPVGALAAWMLAGLDRASAAR